MKWMGILLVIATMNGMGLQIAHRYKKRIAFWNILQQTARRFLNEIRYTVDSPLTILNRMPYWPATGTSFAEKFQSGVAMLGQSLKLSKEELALVYAFGQELGATDLEGQLHHCAIYEQVFSEHEKEAAQAYVQKGKLYRSLFMLGSVTVGIVMI